MNYFNLLELFNLKLFFKKIKLQKLNFYLKLKHKKLVRTSNRKFNNFTNRKIKYFK